MLARQRQDAILDEVRHSGAVRVSELVRRFGVSDMTIRRDLDALARRGHVEKVYGGATAGTGNSTDEPGFEAKSARQRAEKEGIARLAAQQVEPGSAIGVTAGTTTWTLARHLADIAELTVVTNSVRVAETLWRLGRSDQSVVLTGGERTPSDALVGPVATATLRSVHLDLVFLGVHGMAASAGFTTPNLAEAETNRAFAQAAARLAVLADSAKWSTVGFSTIVELAEVDLLVSDTGLDEEAAAALREEVPQVQLAHGEPGGTGDADPATGLGEDAKQGTEQQ